jgi:transcriptional regulator with XRE-family HTH domain
MTATEILTAIASAAKEKNISGYALAKITRLDARHVYRILNGEHSPSLDTVLKLCAAVGIGLEIFNLGEMPAKIKKMAYQSNCGMGDDTPAGFTFSATSFAGDCQCGQGGCFGEYGDFIPKDHESRDKREEIKNLDKTRYLDSTFPLLDGEE